jgi:hypothetical protein
MAVEKAISYDQARKKINKAAPKGHQLAFITPAEAKMLKDKGGSGEMTEAGVKSYRGHHGGGGGGSSSGSGSGSSGGSGGGGGGDRNKDRGQKKGRKSSKAAQTKSSKKSTTKSTTKTSKQSFSDKLKEARKKNEKALKDVAKKQADFNKRTGFQTKSGFLKDKFGNIVRSKVQVDKVRAEQKREKALRDMFASQIQSQEVKQVNPTFSGLQGFLDKTRKRLGTGEFSVEKANQLKDINRALGDFDYAGMSIGNQLRAQAGDLAAGIPGLAKIGGAIAGGPLGIAGLIASGGKGIAGLIADKLGIGRTEDKKTDIATGKFESGQAQPGFLEGIASTLGIGAPAVGGGRPFGGDGRGQQRAQLPKTTDRKQKKISKVMREYKKGKLNIGQSNKKVKNRKQAVAIALSEAGVKKKKRRRS